jgi:hypothetical protein
MKKFLMLFMLIISFSSWAETRWVGLINSEGKITSQIDLNSIENKGEYIEYSEHLLPNGDGKPGMTYTIQMDCKRNIANVKYYSSVWSPINQFTTDGQAYRYVCQQQLNAGKNMRYFR